MEEYKWKSKPINQKPTSPSTMVTTDLSITSNFKTLLFLQLSFFLTLFFSRVESLQIKPNTTIPAMFVFGDSTVDPGNNNYISTPFKSNFPPYGRDFHDHRPTGRFSNGRLATDFIASYYGIKEEIPPYLNEYLSMEELLTGVSFASAGSGYDPFTAEITEVLPISKQLDYFKQYVKRVQGFQGKERSEELFHRAVFVCSCGTNDFVNDYFLVPQRRESLSLEDYQIFLLQQTRDFVQGLYELGARKIVMIGLPPMGCLPVVITLNSRNMMFGRECIASLNSVARDYNQKLKNLLSLMQQTMERNDGKIKIIYGDIYTPLMDMIVNPAKSGFEESACGCCGTGLIEASFLCNSRSPVCPDASRYIFWDSIHPTEMAYRVLADSIFKSLGNLVLS